MTTNLVQVFELDLILAHKARFCFQKHNAADVRGSLNKFPDFFRMGNFIDSTHMKL